ncbi:MAG TPA: preprotein translocase subunit SecE, partial [Methylothermaceae bacterium]|nr:preprotein translocase subunit SecE [Methylothermaceae bacterium]
MTAQANSTESAASVFDSIKLTIALALLAAGVVGFYVYVEYSLLYRTLALVAIAILSCG